MPALKSIVKWKWPVRAFCGGIALQACGVCAQQLDPLAVRNQSVLTRLYGVPAAQPAHLLPLQSTLWQLGSNTANTFVSDASDREAVFLDGESEEIGISVRHALRLGSQHVELSAALNGVHHGGGFLDHGIEQFHSTFGLPQGNRTRFADNRLRYAYRDGGELPLEFERSGAALGDTELGAAWRLHDGEQALALRATLKLPTGDADNLSGSGAADVALALHGAQPLGHGQLDAAVGVVLLGDGDVLAEQQRRSAAYGHIAYAYPWSHELALLAQLGGNSGVYDDTQMTGLKDSAFIAVGARWRVHPDWSLEAALTEDILVNSVPDVAFMLGVRFTNPATRD